MAFLNGFESALAGVIALAALAPPDEIPPLFYGLRAVAFFLILAAIVDKNRAEGE